MKILLLPGVNPATIDWLHFLTEKLSLAEADTVLNNYQFWSAPDEEKSLSREVANLPGDDFDLIIGKSLGTLILLQALYEKRIVCNQALLIGIPSAVIDQKADFKPESLELLKGDDIFIVQQVNDQLGPANMLEPYAPSNLLVIEGNDHLYESYDFYVDDVLQWLKIPSA